MNDHSDCCSYHGCQYDEDDCPAVVNGFERCSECKYDDQWGAENDIDDEEGESEWSFIDEDDYDEGPH